MSVFVFSQYSYSLYLLRAPVCEQKNIAHTKLQSSESTNRLKHKSVNIAQKLSIANRYNVHSISLTDLCCNEKSSWPQESCRQDCSDMGWQCTQLHWNDVPWQLKWLEYCGAASAVHRCGYFKLLQCQ